MYYAGGRDCRKIYYKEYWDRIKNLENFCRTLQHYPTPFSPFQALQPYAISAAATISVFHKYIEPVVPLMAISYTFIIVFALLAIYNVTFMMYYECFEKNKVRDKHEPGVVVLLKISSLGFLSYKYIFGYIMLLALFVAPFTHWGPYCQIITQITEFTVEVNHYLHDQLGLNISLPYMAERPREFGFNPIVLAMITSILIFFPPILYFTFFYLTIFIDAPRLVNILAWFLAAFIYIFHVAGSLLLIYTVFDVSYSTILFKIYSKFIMFFFDSIGKTEFKIARYYVPLLYAPHFTLIISSISYYISSLEIEFHTYFPKHIEETADCRRRFTSLYLNENFMKIIEESGSVQMKVTCLSCLFDDEIMDIKNLKADQLFHVIRYRDDMKHDISRYSKHYNYIFKRASEDYYMKLYKADTWTSEKRDILIEESKRRKRIEKWLNFSNQQENKKPKNN